LNRIDDQQGWSALGGQCQDRVEGLIADECQLRGADFQSLGPQCNLRHRLLAAGIDGQMLLRQRGPDLQQQRRFTDTRLAAQQGH
jgi:hypothetical protein